MPISNEWCSMPRFLCLRLESQGRVDRDRRLLICMRFLGEGFEEVYLYHGNWGISVMNVLLYFPWTIR